MKLNTLLPFVFAGISYHPGQTLDTDVVEMDDSIRKDLIAAGKATPKPVTVVKADDPTREYARHTHPADAAAVKAQIAASKKRRARVDPDDEDE